MNGRRGTRWALGALVWTVLVGVGLAVGPTGRSESVTVLSDGTQTTESASTTLVESEGASILVVLAVPVLAAAASVTVAMSPSARRWRAVVAGVMVAGCLLGAASIGIFYLPAAIAAVVAAAMTRSAGERSRAGGDGVVT